MLIFLLCLNDNVLTWNKLRTWVEPTPQLWNIPSTISNFRSLHSIRVMNQPLLRPSLSENYFPPSLITPLETAFSNHEKFSTSLNFVPACPWWMRLHCLFCLQDKSVQFSLHTRCFCVFEICVAPPPPHTHTHTHTHIYIYTLARRSYFVLRSFVLKFEGKFMFFS
jgi:hypothetical protein